MAADYRVRRNVTLTAEQEFHERLMWEIVVRVQRKGLILKGGSALAFTRGINRHSTDLDFDTTHPVRIERQMKAAAQAVAVTMEEVRRFTKRRVGQQFKTRYSNPHSEKPKKLKVDVRFQHPPREEDVQDPDGIRTYCVEAIFEQKLAAMDSRTEPRDLFDVAFIVERYGEKLTPEQVRRAAELASDDEGLRDKYRIKFSRDEVLSHVTLASTIRQLSRGVSKQRKRAWPEIMEQSIPIPDRVLGRIFVAQGLARLQRNSKTGSSRKVGTVSPDPRRPTNWQRLLREHDRTATRDRDLDWPIRR